MLNTTADMYRAFLDGIKKEQSAIVSPENWNRIINHWGQDEWIKMNLTDIEDTQKEIEDMEKLRVVTDGSWVDVSVPVGVLYPIAPDTGFDYQFSIPKYVNTNINNRLTNGTVSTQTYPKYLRFLNVMFKLTYGTTNECGLTGVSEWLSANVMFTGRSTVYKNLSFRQPKDSRLYYEMLEGKIRLITSTNSTGYAMRLEYYRYPVEIYFNKTDPTDTGVPATGSVCCEFSPRNRKEIVDIAVRTYLERVKDPRYQSFLNEEIVKSKSN